MEKFSDWAPIIALIASNFALIIPLWLWNRSEARQDTRRSLDLIEAIKDEMKDFHGRLCSLEERQRRK